MGVNTGCAFVGGEVGLKLRDRRNHSAVVCTFDSISLVCRQILRGDDTCVEMLLRGGGGGTGEVGSTVGVDHRAAWLRRLVTGRVVFTGFF